MPVKKRETEAVFSGKMANAAIGGIPPIPKKRGVPHEGRT